MQTEIDNSIGEERELDKLLPLTTAQERLGVSRSQLYRLLEEQAIPRPIKIGRRSYFSQRELQQWINTRLAQRADGGAQ